MSAEPVGDSLQARALQLLAAQQARLERVEVLVERELQRIEEELADQCDQSDRMRAERDALAAQLADMETGPTASRQEPGEVPGDNDGRSSSDDFRRRYELALDDVHDLKAKNAELQRQLEDTHSTAASEQVIAEKDRQIRELEQRLEEQRGDSTAAAPDAAAIARAIDGDAAIREEREQLKRLQEEWREKLRQAEIDLALERAKLARQRAELEERLNTSRDGLPKPPTEAGAASRTEQPASKRWLARLGLTEADKERGRH